MSPDPARSRDERELPAYVSNGLIGLRVRDVPLTSGMALVSGFAGEHPERRIEATATAPYPLAGDVAINGVWLSDALHQVRNLEQSYDFSTGELTSEFGFSATDVSLRCEILTFASRGDPTLVCQEVSLTFDSSCDVNVKSMSSMELTQRPLNRFQCVMNFDAFQAKRKSGGVWLRQVATASKVGVR